MLASQARHAETRVGFFLSVDHRSWPDRAPSLSGVVFPILALSFLGELTFALWLIVKGLDAQKWRQVEGEAAT